MCAAARTCRYVRGLRGLAGFACLERENWVFQE